MKNLLTSILLLYYITASSQNDPIVIGCEFDTIPNKVFLDKLATGDNINLYSAFNYSILEYLKEHLNENDIEYSFKKMELSSAVRELTVNNEIDFVLNNFSVSPKRKADSIHFSLPYYVNPGIGILVQNDNKYDSHNPKIKNAGCIKGTRSNDQLIIYNSGQVANKMIKYEVFEDYDQLKEAYLSKRIDAIIGDITVLLTLNLKDTKVVDYLQTPFSKVKDKIAIGIHKNRPELVKTLNKFVLEYTPVIKIEQDKWLGSVVNNWSPQPHDSHKNFLQYLVYFLAGSLGLGLFAFLYLLNKKNDKAITNYKSMLSNYKNGLETFKTEIDQIPSKVMNEYHKRLNLDKNSALLVEEGTRMLDSAKEEILYVGSGGFMTYGESKTELKKASAWRSAIYNTMFNPNINFTRVIDLPFIQELKEMPNNDDSREYITKFLIWISTLYYDMVRINNKTVTVYNTRGAAQWGFGLIIMVQDKSEILLFSQIGKQRLGTKVVSLELAKQMSIMGENAGNHGDKVDRDYIVKHYFERDKPLSELMLLINNFAVENFKCSLGEIKNKNTEDLRIPLKYEQREELIKMCETMSLNLLPSKF